MDKMNRCLLTLLLFVIVGNAFAQVYTRNDTLRGSITKERKWWDVQYYHLEVRVDPEQKSLEGSNTILYRVLQKGAVMQIDLQAPLQLRKAMAGQSELSFTREGSAYLLELPEEQVPGTVGEVVLFYGGQPKEAVRPPWDGGLSWDTDQNGKPFIATSCQGIGASIWWPLKDHPSDEPDSLLLSVTVPKDLVDVSNGRLRELEVNPDGTHTYHWFVSNPINSYGVNINIGDYVHFSEKFEGEKGALDLDYYVLRDNLEKAKVQFQQVTEMLEAFEFWFGPYPFYEDGYKLVEAPYLGMEHQSSITYGNGYQNGYRGMDLSNSGWGLKFDFIIIHESGHEWFANNITYRDRADMWIHESFTNYSESLFLEYHYGKEAACEYVRGTRSLIVNDRPIIPDYNVNRSGSGDMYYKGGNMLHMLRQIVDNDELWREVLRGLNARFYHQTVKSSEIEAFISEKTGLELGYFFDQYLRDVRIPILEYRLAGEFLSYRWTNCVEGFLMPVQVMLDDRQVWLQPGETWNKVKLDRPVSSLKVDPDYYVASLSITALGLD